MEGLGDAPLGIDCANLPPGEGVYILTVLLSGRFLCKIGMTTDIPGRLQSYLAYYPTGFNLWYVVSCPSGDERSFESLLHRVLAGKGLSLVDAQGNPCPHGHATEWFELKLSDLKKLKEYDFGGREAWDFNGALVTKSTRTVPRRLVKASTPTRRAAGLPIATPTKNGQNDRDDQDDQDGRSAKRRCLEF